MEQSALGQQEGGKLLHEDGGFWFLCFTRLSGALVEWTFSDAAPRYDALTDSSSYSNTPPRCHQMCQDGSFNLP